MIHHRPDYALIQDPSGGIPEDEPVFLLRGQDLTAHHVVRLWADLAARRGATPEIVGAARLHAGAMERWARRAPKGAA